MLVQITLVVKALFTKLNKMLRLISEPGAPTPPAGGPASSYCEKGPMAGKAASSSSGSSQSATKTASSSSGKGPTAGKPDSSLI